MGKTCYIRSTEMLSRKVVKNIYPTAFVHWQYNEYLGHVETRITNGFWGVPLSDWSINEYEAWKSAAQRINIALQDRLSK